jgi:glucose dehydrogenase
MRRRIASIAALALAACGAGAPSQRSAGAAAFAAARAKAAPAEREWRRYLNDGDRSPLAQIDRTNVGALRVAWAARRCFRSASD